MARKGKPVILATGASDIGEVQQAVHAVLAINPQLMLMQCNTNYTASLENFNHIHLRVLKTYQADVPQCGAWVCRIIRPGTRRCWAPWLWGRGRSKNISPTAMTVRARPQICDEPQRLGRYGRNYPPLGTRAGFRR